MDYVGEWKIRKEEESVRLMGHSAYMVQQCGVDVQTALLA